LAVKSLNPFRKSLHEDGSPARQLALNPTAASGERRDGQQQVAKQWEQQFHSERNSNALSPIGKPALQHPVLTKSGIRHTHFPAPDVPALTTSAKVQWEQRWDRKKRSQSLRKCSDWISRNSSFSRIQAHEPSLDRIPRIRRDQRGISRRPPRNNFSGRWFNNN
jgi:hypothetical protein